MTTFLTLPTDVRDAIIERVLLARNPAPQSVAEASSRRYHRGQPSNVDGRTYSGLAFVRLSRARIVPNDRGLLLTNRQLSLETKAAVTHLRASGRLEHLMDVMIVDDDELWPTWLCVPTATRTLDRLLVTFRVFGARRRARPSAYRWNASPRVIMHGFFFLIQHLLLIAPGNVAVQSLVLDFSDGPEGYPADVAAADWLAIHDEYTQEIPNHVDVTPIVPRPRWIGDMLAEYIATCLTMRYQAARYGALLYERLGTINFTANGKQVVRHDLGLTIAPLSFTDASETFGHVDVRMDRISAFWIWKTAALQSRRAFGLSTASPVAHRQSGGASTVGRPRARPQWLSRVIENARHFGLRSPWH
ncbi:hypothetical protein EXIGLDRAFT_729501 [Exidia glandulosa HHB12029]|uniref:Uncharacterized protein n=1 Tax=Exidia glandulosa HHB12029 TaxID=1314781 RepID=A0A165CJT2_EXIGL|nr:hypothetical protein EXIGLDRAFT_729501 [Exidia glandulosa HHB12029]